MSKIQRNEWKNFHSKLKMLGKFPKYPNTTMIKTLFGDYLKKKILINKKTKVIDVGCGFGNNLIPFLDSGCKTYGLEIDDRICKLTQDIIEKKYNKNKITIKLGHNRSIPFNSNFFDLMITNTLHYEETHKDINLALREFQRVLKNNGVLYLETTGNKHNFFKSSKKIKKNIYINQDKSDKIRYKKVFFFFEKEMNLKKILKKYFKTVVTGRVTEKINESYYDSFLAVCFNKK